MSIRMTVLAEAAVAATWAVPGAAQTRYFDTTPTPEDLQRALMPQAAPRPAAPTQQQGEQGQAQPPLRGNTEENRAGRLTPPLATSIPVPPEPPKVGLTVTFGFNSTELTPESRRVLDVLAIAI